MVWKIISSFSSRFIDPECHRGNSVRLPALVFRIIRLLIRDKIILGNNQVHDLIFVPFVSTRRRFEDITKPPQPKTDRIPGHRRYMGSSSCQTAGAPSWRAQCENHVDRYEWTGSSAWSDMAESVRLARRKRETKRVWPGDDSE